MIYIVVWSGGYDAPSYQAFNDYDKAFSCAKEWEKDMAEDIDTIDVISLNEDTLEMKRLYEA